jgi:hypothetical protein
MLAGDVIFRRNDRVEYRALEGEGGVLLHLDTANYHGVNQVGSLVWDLLDGRPFAALVAELQERLEGVPPTFEAEIAAFLEDLSARELVVQEPGSG